MTKPQRGSLIVVGTGIKLAQHCTPEARDTIVNCDILYAAGGDPITQQWLAMLNANMVSLHDVYRAGRRRDKVYEDMVETVLDGVRSGKAVCAVFYGHPGVYVYASHEAIRRARLEGYEARMLPGISAEDCLYADLGVDPGRTGCQSYEATDFLINARKIDPTAALVLWQIALAGERTLRVLDSDPERLEVLAEVLMHTYPADHLVTVYEAATLPITQPKIQQVRLQDLHTVSTSQESTLYVPPLSEPQPCPDRIALLDARLASR